MGNPDASSKRRASLQEVFANEVAMKREALGKLNRRANEIPPVAAEVLLAVPLCTVVVQ